MKVKMHAPFILAGVIVVMLALSAWSLTSYRDRLSDILEEKTQSDMKRFTKQSILLFNSMINDYFIQLETSAQFFSVNGEDTESSTALLREINRDGHYMRLGAADTSGKLSTGDGVFRDISDMPYFQKALQGERVISDVYRDTESEEDVLSLAVPIIQSGKIVGVTCAQYNVSTFADLLGKSQFEGKGATMVMQKNGKMVSGYDGMERYDTFYDALQPMEFRGVETLESFRNRINNGESGFFTYFRNDKERYVYFAPTGLNDYVMISLVLAEALDPEFQVISREALFLTVKNVFYYCIILACCWFIAVCVRKLLQECQRDQLTQVFNKNGARVAVESLLKKQGQHEHHACLFLDLDNFKSVNDCYGHDAGDRLLREVTNLLADSFRKTDVVGRFGGDEFVVWMNCTSLENAEKKANFICDEILKIGGHLSVSTSVGIACYPEHGASYDQVLVHADKALYFAKKLGKNRYCVYEPDKEE